MLGLSMAVVTINTVFIWVWGNQSGFLCLEYLCNVFWIWYFQPQLSVTLLHLAIKLSLSAVAFWCFVWTLPQQKQQHHH